MNRTLSASRGVSPWAWVLAVAVHVLFVMVLVFGVAWQHQVVAPVEAELWSDLPAAATVAKPPPPQPVVVPTPAPPVTPPAPAAADIALKKKKEKELEAQKQTQKREHDVAEQIRQQRTEALKEQQQEDA
ncbi:MAG: hypothetical protein G3I10_06160, partial [Ferrovum sp.]|nr:hypothetical protein [Ferrovum sp.]